MSNDNNDNNNDAPPHTTLDDCDVNWQYGGDTWGTNHTDDPLRGDYHGGTFYSTTVHKAWARLCWTGMNIEVFGGKRKNHGLYTVVIDNGELQWLSGFSETDQIQASLIKTQELGWGNHQIVLTNMPKTNMTVKSNIWFDIDYAEIDGWPIDCKDLPENTVIPSSTIAPAITTTPTSINSTYTGNATASTTGGVNNTTANNATSATLTKAPLASGNSSATLLSSTSAISPTTTVTMSSSSISPSGSNATSTESTSGALYLQPGMESQLALIGLMGIYCLRLLF
ncbi:uncharacterized protein L201_006726 [Kwoniella dendrophila CBS 6074]|uniref:Uncharacterized protein n=1 Tax=Kwoniella dendrophila CBS 6074 TaxID=1295534 RepID=A0AAX4K3U6_9TREE